MAGYCIPLESPVRNYFDNLNTENTDKPFPTPVAAGDAPNNHSNKEGGPAEQSVRPLVAKAVAIW